MEGVNESDVELVVDQVWEHPPDHRGTYPPLADAPAAPAAAAPTLLDACALSAGLG